MNYFITKLSFLLIASYSLYAAELKDKEILHFPSDPHVIKDEKTNKSEQGLKDYNKDSLGIERSPLLIYGYCKKYNLNLSTDILQLITSYFVKCQTLKGHTASVRKVFFSPNSNRIVSADTDGKVCIWSSYYWKIAFHLQRT